MPRTSPLLVGLFVLAGCPGPSTDTAKATVDANTAPTAEAGPNISQSADVAVQLNGSASVDQDGDTLTFHWSFDYVPEGSALTSKESPFSKNNAADAATPTFMADRVGTYIVKLVVNDGTVDSAPDTVIVTIDEPENLPVANAGADVTATVGETVTLDGSKSYDPIGRTLSYAWTLVDKPTASSLSSLGSADTVAPSFVPDARGVYVLNLVVDNGLAKSNSDAVNVTVTGDDSAPVANAGEDQPDAEDCTTIQLDCSGSVDPDGDTLQYMWEVQSKPSNSSVSNASFSDRTAARPTFWPDVSGAYVLSCTAYDGKTWSTPDTVAITAAERATNTAPVASAGDDETSDGGSASCEEDGYEYDCDECAEVTVNLGSTARASDPDGDPYTIAWTIADGSSATIADSSSLVTTAVLEDAEPTEPGECEDVEFEFTLSVTDCTGAVSTDTVKYTVTCCGVEDT